MKRNAALLMPFAAASAAALLAPSMPGTAARAQAPAATAGLTITVDTKSPPGSPLPADFSGLSYETQDLLPNSEGKHYFRPDNAPLVALFRSLGIHSLRVGGNTVDSPKVAIPSNDDIDSLFAFAKAAGIKVIYTLRLRDGKPDDAAATAKYILSRYADNLTCFEVGNEPDIYLKTFPAYKAALDTFYGAMTAAAPSARFCGPATTGGHIAWVKDYATAFGGADSAPGTSRVAYLVQHSYPGGAGNKVVDETTAAAARDKLLSPTLAKSYDHLAKICLPPATESKIPFRLEETNSFYNAGAKNASDTFAASLWGLDYLWWWASHGAAGLNYHTGDKTAAGPNMITSRYASFVSLADGSGYEVRPMGYALKAFSLVEDNGQTNLRTTSIAPENAANVTAYASGNNTVLFLTIINKEHGPDAKSIPISLNLGDTPYASASEAQLIVPNGDVAAQTGITLGDSGISSAGEWKGRWLPLPKPAPGDRYTVTAAPASAIILRFQVAP